MTSAEKKNQASSKQTFKSSLILDTINHKKHFKNKALYLPTIQYRMYHHHHQAKNIHSSSRMSIPSERHMFLQTGNGSSDSGLVLSTDAKPRLKWTPDLHARFIEAVNQLGGADSKYTYIHIYIHTVWINKSRGI